jgi:hypothetical protein
VAQVAVAQVALKVSQAVTHLKMAQLTKVAVAEAQSVTVVKTVVDKAEEQEDQVSSL